jgi:hypothetical protein
MNFPTTARTPIQRFEHDIRVVHRFHGQRRGRTAEKQFRRGETRGRAQRGGRVRRFHRPHAAAQPVEQRHVVGGAAEERLTEMDVRLDESGQQVCAARVDDRLVRLRGFVAD